MPRPSVGEERRGQILDAALAVFSRLGFQRATMDDVASEARLSKPALYLYYKSKDALIGALMRAVFSRELRGVRGLLDAEGSVRERILRMTEQVAGELERMSLALPVMLEFYAVAARQQSVREYLSDAYAEYRDVLTALFEQGIARGELRPGSADDAAVTLTALYEGLILIWVMNPKALDWRARANAATRLVLDGMRPEVPTPPPAS